MNEYLIELLTKDLEGEHAAIIQYLVHAYSMGEGEIACEIEAIARDEMRHFDWLAETIVSLGEAPSMTRGTMRTAGGPVSDWMRDDLFQEDDGIAMYESHIRIIKDPKINRLLTRILADEKAHRAVFHHLIGKANKVGARDVRGHRFDDVTKTLNWGIAHEYNVILQYLFHRYMTPRVDVQREMEDQAINEMQHLSWLSETLVDIGSIPTIEHGAFDKSLNTSDMLRADIRIEKKVADRYEQAINAIEDPKIKSLLTRIRDNEIYHAGVFTDLLKEGEEPDRQK